MPLVVGEGEPSRPGGMVPGAKARVLALCAYNGQRTGANRHSHSYLGEGVERENSVLPV